MKARMKFLVQSMGWEKSRAAVDAERATLGPLPPLDDFLEAAPVPAIVESPATLNVLNPVAHDPQYQALARDSVIAHRIEGLRGVHVRTKFGDITSV